MEPSLRAVIFTHDIRFVDGSNQKSGGGSPVEVGSFTHYLSGQMVHNISPTQISLK